MGSERIRVITAGLLCLAAAVHADPPAIGFGAGQSMNPREVVKAARAGETPRIIRAGYVAGQDPSAGKPSSTIEWVSIPGGEFTMGTDDRGKLFSDAKPSRKVTIQTFEMSKTLVTVEQYAKCVVTGACTEPATGRYCNWGVPGREFHPINCVSWKQADLFAGFQGARLPTEAEWEYAATSGGKNQKYPWGNEEASCERAVMSGNNGYGCGNDSTMPVCSKPAGNARFDSGGDLCDAVGNVWQWMQDIYKDSYAGAPTDGRAVEGAGSTRVIRGGSFKNEITGNLRADVRTNFDPGYRMDFIGFRLVKGIRFMPL